VCGSSSTPTAPTAQYMEFSYTIVTFLSDFAKVNVASISRHIHIFELLQFFDHYSAITFIVKNNNYPVLICSGAGVGVQGLKAHPKML